MFKKKYDVSFTLSVGVIVAFITANVSVAQQRTEISNLPILSDTLRIQDVGRDKNGAPIVVNLADALRLKISTAIKDTKTLITPADEQVLLDKLTRYVSFLGLDPKDLFTQPESDSAANSMEADTVSRSVFLAEADEGGEPEDSAADGASREKVFPRLLNSSLQFLLCPLTDWACIEKQTPIIPAQIWRRDSLPQLGAPIRAGKSLVIEGIFTEGWSLGKDEKLDPRQSLAAKFGERILKFGRGGLSMAIYGMNETENSMKPVFDAIKEVNDFWVSRGDPMRVRAVFDRQGTEKTTRDSPWLFTYVRPADGGRSPNSRWMLSPDTKGSLYESGKPKMKTVFQYEDSNRLLSLLNDGIRNDELSRGRLEWPISNIMHNKFLVMRSLDEKDPALSKSVWTGTANMSANCMGEEHNSNLAILIRNTQIANAFEKEFDEMFTFDPLLKSDTVTSVTPDGRPIPMGRFHRQKRPNTQRYFTFDDGTEVRVHFAPTDDAEHRVILPMLLSARPGDVIRISMFGNAGYEIVRAIQFAIANGATVKILLDRQQGAGAFSWANAQNANLMDVVLNKNPYQGKTGRAPGRFIFLRSNYSGKNHQKTGSLTRRMPNGTMREESIIIGSQNWSTGGNDANDENLISIQNLKSPRGLKIISDFNRNFEERSIKVMVVPQTLRARTISPLLPKVNLHLLPLESELKIPVIQ